MIASQFMLGVVASGWAVYPFTLGLVAAVNPCGFPLLPVYLGLFIEGEAADRRGLSDRLLRAMGAAAAATVGFVVVFGTLGLLTELGVTAYSPSSAVARYVMAVLGCLMVFFGVRGLFGRSIRLPHIELHGHGQMVSLFVFGISYAVASLGCALPLFLGGVAATFSRSGGARGAGDFIAYALGMGLLLVVAALSMAIAGNTVLRKLHRATRLLQPLGAIVITLVGAYLVLYWTTAIIAPTTTLAPVRAVESVQASVAGWIQAEATLLGIVLGAIVVVGLLILGIVSERSDHGTSPRLRRRGAESR